MSRRQAYNTAITSRGLRPYLNAQRSVHAEFQAGIAVVRFVGDVGDGSSDGEDSNGDGEAEEVEDKEEEEEEEDDNSDGDVGEDEAGTWRYAVWKWALLVLVAILLSLSLLAVGRTLRSPSTARTVTTIERVCWQLVSTTAYSYGHCIRERMMFATFQADELEESERRVSGAENAKTAGYEAGPEPEPGPGPAKKRGVGGERKQGRCVESGTVVVQFPRERRQMVIDQVCYVSDTINDSGGGEGREERIAIVGRLVS